MARQGLLSIAAIVLSGLWLVMLPGTTALYRFVEHVNVPANADRFSVPPLQWPMDTYQKAPSLALYRDTFAEHCAALTPITPERGLLAARCISDLLAKRFAHRTPRSEFFSKEYSPEEALRAHLAGAQGHCTSRAGLMATMLLAIGVPARVVQVLNPQVGGHTLIEVLTESHWVAVDPSYGVVLGDGSSSLSLSEALDAPDVLARERWVSPDPASMFALNSYQYFKRALGARMMIPDPWMYTRIGAASAPWPYRTTVLVEGPPALAFGVQNWIAAGFFASSVAWFVVYVLSLLRQMHRANDD